ncbi:hypothetical protein BC833DRAFT_226737 [Globomyces pollinis-pini]|nr:hypothetical protein BC833DRAFT_226737 [Globomyces pollinis-pini]
MQPNIKQSFRKNTLNNGESIQGTIKRLKRTIESLDGVDEQRWANTMLELITLFRNLEDWNAVFDNAMILWKRVRSSRNEDSVEAAQSISEAALNVGNLDLAIDYAKMCIDIASNTAKHLKVPDALVDGYYLLGIAYLKRSELQPTDVQTAERVFAIAMKHLSHLNNPRSKTKKSHNQIELIYKRIEVNLGGIRNDIPLLLSLFKDFTTKFECFTTQESIAAHLSRSFFKLKQYEDSLKWCLLEKQYKVNRKDLRGEATCLQRLLNLMEKLQQFSKMRDVTCRLKQISSSLKDKNVLDLTLVSIYLSLMARHLKRRLIHISRTKLCWIN